VNQMDRRRFLGTGLKGAAGMALLGTAGSSFLAACSSTTTTGTGTGSSGGTAAAGSLGTLDFQLSWIKNGEFAGEYMADQKGYYKDQGFTGVNLIAGGPNVQQDAVVVAGKAFSGISVPDTVAAAINQGGPITIIGAQYQKNPFAIMSLASKPVKTPQDMAGKKIGVQSVNEPVWNSFLKANNIDPSTIEKVTVQFDPTPLVNGEVDGWMSFITNEPNLLKVKGVDTYNFLMNDFKYPSVSEVYIVQKASLQSSRDKLKAMLRAEIKGWQAAIADPATAAGYVTSIYGKDLGLDTAEQTLEITDESKLILTPDTAANGLFTITDKQKADTVATLALGGTTIAQADLFDTSVLEEVYKENPELKTSPSLPASTGTTVKS
jgi:ABC-type nitrate/sulfonate/bicarbonate transport system substrate-binding protein